MKARITFLLIGLIAMATLYAVPYAKRCKVCQSEYNKKHGCTTPNPAWRDFETPLIHKDGQVLATYRCPSGHKFLVDISKER